MKKKHWLLPPAVLILGTIAILLIPKFERHRFESDRRISIKLPELLMPMLSTQFHELASKTIARFSRVFLAGEILRLRDSTFVASRAKEDSLIAEITDSVRVTPVTPIAYNRGDTLLVLNSAGPELDRRLRQAHSLRDSLNIALSVTANMERQMYAILESLIFGYDERDDGNVQTLQLVVGLFAIITSSVLTLFAWRRDIREARDSEARSEERSDPVESRDNPDEGPVCL